MERDTVVLQPRIPSILVGELRIFEPRNGKVLISVESGINAGEAASLDANELQALLEEFYTKYF